MADTDPLAKLDVLYERSMQREAWQEAGRNRLQAAPLAHMRGRTDLFRQYIQQAIDMARAHDLERLELGARITRFTYLLMEDLTGQILEELRGDLKCELTASGAELTGALIEQLEGYSLEALAAYDALLTSLEAAPAALTASIDRAREKAAAFALVYLGGQFAEARELLNKGDAAASNVGEQIRAAANSARAETGRICAGLRVDLFLLAAELERKRGDPETAEDAFRKAEQLSEMLPEQRAKVYMAWADHADGRGKLKLATSYAKKAVDASQQISSAALKAQAAGKLNDLLARGEPEQSAPAPTPLPGSGASDRVMWVLENAHQALLARRFEESLQLANQALEQAARPQLRRAVLRERAIALYELARFDEAETDLDACISQLSAELSSDAAAAAGALDSRTGEEENLYLLKAFLKAKAGQNIESWNIAEQGRSRRLKREISASKGSPGAKLQDGAFDTVRPWLHAKRAAMLSFAATPWGTLALTAGPDDAEPQAQILDQFPVRELKRLLGPDQSEESETWTTIILQSVPGLSAGLIHGLLPRLRTITQGADVLYIIPDSYLYYAPFAALTLDASPNSPTLIDLSPLAITSSSAILLWSGSRPVAAAARGCLAVAVGRDSEGFEFHQHLHQLECAPWPMGQRPTELQDAAATAAEVASQAPQYAVLYFSCHGLVNPESRDIMAASQLMLAGGPLSARDVATWKLSAGLIFLNACQSGRFRLQARSDVNGFVRAFPLAGARSLIAPLIHVGSRAAGDLAESFFRAWLGGESKARALRSAQIAARQKDPDCKDWAAYCLIGDFQ